MDRSIASHDVTVFRHRFVVQAPVDDVAHFHVQTSSMALITPPPVIVQVHDAPQQVADGAEMDFTLWLGPLPVRWQARFENVMPGGFTDRQLQGPFQTWVHRHSFIDLGQGQTEVRDEIDIELQHQSPWWKVVGLLMRLNLPVLFAYRSWRTRYLLQNKPGFSQRMTK